jgi:hypothetical protein
MKPEQPEIPDELVRRRREGWAQTPQTHIPDADAAAAFIERVGVATLFPASPEIPDLFRAYMGDPDPPVDAKWDSPSGHVYTWRWALGHANAAFYVSLVRGRPTYVRWSLLPAVLRLFGTVDRDAPDLYAAGEISRDAAGIARALATADDPPATLSTGEIRRRAGFPTGKEQRAAYLKALGELEGRVLTAKVFSGREGDDEMYHALVSVRHGDAVAQARTLSRAAALDALLSAYMPHAAFALPKTLSRHLGLSEAEVMEGLAGLPNVQKLINRGTIIYTREAN